LDILLLREGSTTRSLTGYLLRRSCLYWIDQGIIVLFVSAFIALLISFALGVRSLIWGRKKYFRFQGVAIFAFVIPFLAAFLLSEILSSYSYREAKNFLADIGEAYQISINGEFTEEKAEVLAMLHNMDNRPFQAHKSHPTKRIKIAIGEHGEVLKLELGRDSQLPREYWVFYPKYENTRENEIARVTTSILDRY
jgi:hypothetical protein